MKCVKIYPNRLKGKITIPPSKSMSHRAIICASLSPGVSKIDNLIFSHDINATCQGMENLGGKIEKIGDNSLKIKGNLPLKLKESTIDCNESGSTLRFLIPLSLLTSARSRFIAKGELVSRPLDTYYKIFHQQGIKYKNNKGNLPLEIEGELKPGVFEIVGNISSQFITGLMFSLPLLKEDSKIIIRDRLQSKGYVDLTIDMLNRFGIEIINRDYKEFHIRGNQAYKNKDYKVEGDFSQAAFWLVGGIIGEKIELEGLNINSLQGDKVILDLIRKMGGSIKIEDLTMQTTISETRGIVIDACQCPDIVPILAVLAALSKGETRIINAGRLRIKESDRLKAISTELNKLGAHVKELEDGLVIMGKDTLTGGLVDSWKDHRIAMALAIASQRSSGEVVIQNSDSVNKSYPHFWEDFKSLGGKIDEFDMGR